MSDNQELGQEMWGCEGNGITFMWCQYGPVENNQFLIMYTGAADDPQNDVPAIVEKVNAGTGFNLKNETGVFVSSRSFGWSDWSWVECYTNSHTIKGTKKQITSHDPQSLYRHFQRVVNKAA